MDVKTIAIAILGGAFDSNELGDNDIACVPGALEDLQVQHVTGCDDVQLELVERSHVDRLTAERDALQQLLNARDEEIADQHQGEPVAWVRFRNGEPDYDGDAVMISNTPGDTLGDGDSWEPVYTRADPGEVERLRKLATDLAGGDIADLEETRRANAHLTGDLQTAEQERDTLRAQLAEMTTKRDRLREGLDNANINIYNWFKDNQKLEAQLAEAHALLRHREEMLTKVAGGWPLRIYTKGNPLMVKTCGELLAYSIDGGMMTTFDPDQMVLSASAEPSAPVVHPINMKIMMQAYEQVDHKELLHGTSNWCAAMATALRATLERKS